MTFLQIERLQAKNATIKIATKNSKAVDPTLQSAFGNLKSIKELSPANYWVSALNFIGADLEYAD